MCLNRFVPRHDDELELEVDDPLLVEVQAEDYWYEGYNMRTGARGIFPAYYAIEVTRDTESYKGINLYLILYESVFCLFFVFKTSYCGYWTFPQYIVCRAKVPHYS